MQFRTILFLIAAAICLLGLADATYLTVSDFAGETVACGGSSSCDEVLSSVYAHFGKVPVASVGALAYFAAFSCAVLTAFGHARARTFLSLIVWVMLAATVWLLYVQAFLLHEFCRYCLFSAALIFLLAGIVTASKPAVAKR